MAIQKSNTWQKVKLSGVNVTIQTWSCYCDQCNASAKAGKDPGEAHENAEKAGFVIVPNKWFNCCKWACPDCHTKSKKNGVTKVSSNNGN